MSTKQNPGPFDCYAKLKDDEPYFVLRAKDPDAPALVEAWARARTLRGAVTDPTGPINPKIEEARQTAEAMRAWRKANINADGTLKHYHHKLGPVIDDRPTPQGDGDPRPMHGMGAVESAFEHGDPGDEESDSRRPGRRW